MKKNFITILAIFIMPVLAYMGLQHSSSISTAKNVEGKPQVVKFSSAMCSDCQKMTKVFETLKPKYAGTIEFTEINVQDNNENIQSQIKNHNITLVPTILLLDSNGNQVRRIEGALPVEQMDGYLKELK